MHPFIGNSVIALCFGAQFQLHGYAFALTREPQRLDRLCDVALARDDPTPTHHFEEDPVGPNEFARFADFLESCPEGAVVSYRGFFQRRSAFEVPIYGLIERYFRVRSRWQRRGSALLQRRGVNLERDLIVNIRGREYKTTWQGRNYFGVDWCERAIATFGASERRVFLVSDDDDIPRLPDGRQVTTLSRRHNPHLDFCVLAAARNLVIPKSTFSFVATMASPHYKRVLYPSIWVEDDSYRFEMVEMLDDAPFIEKVSMRDY
jgi:hypothetical protein